MPFLLHLGFAVLCVLIPCAHGTPIPSPNPVPAPLPIWTENYTGENSYTGAGGNAVGGSVVASTLAKPGLFDIITGGKSILSAFSENAGAGGDASSGQARGARVIGGSALRKVLATGGKSNKAKNGGSNVIGGVVDLPLTGINLDNVTSNSNAGNAYSGSGGNAAGGTVSSSGTLVDLFSHNAGDAGRAGSGASRVMRRKNMNKNRFDSVTETEPQRT